MAARKLKADPSSLDDMRTEIGNRFGYSCATVSAILDLLTHADAGNLKPATLFDAAFGAQDVLQQANKAFDDLNRLFETTR